jgi:hypothetical protein
VAPIKWRSGPAEHVRVGTWWGGGLGFLRGDGIARLVVLQRHINCESVLAKDEALQQNCGFDYADLLAPEPGLSPWLICFTGSAM